MNTDNAIVALFLGILVVTLSFWLGFALREVTPPQTIKETQYILQQCEPTAIDYAKWQVEREQLIKERCPKGGTLEGLIIKCWKY